ncbi:MAG TPA: hypothetical protein VGL91_10630 [Acidobacteriota bacterium]
MKAFYLVQWGLFGNCEITWLFNALVTGASMHVFEIGWRQNSSGALIETIPRRGEKQLIELPEAWFMS